MDEERQLPKETFTDRELNASVGRKLITSPLDANDNTVKTDKLAHVMEVVPILDKLHNTDNLQNRRLSNVLLRHHVTGSAEFTSFEPVTPQYKRLKNGEFAFLTLRIISSELRTGSRAPLSERLQKRFF